MFYYIVYPFGSRQRFQPGGRWLERQGLAVIEASLIALIVLLAAGGIAVLWALVGPEALS